MLFDHKHLLGIEPLSKQDILTILDTAESFVEISTSNSAVRSKERRKRT